MEALTIRPATSSDLAAINDIYNWYVPRSTCTYQEAPETIESRRDWFGQHGERHPVIVAEIDLNELREIVGWGSLSDYRERSGYRFTCENSVYVRHDMHGKGVGSALLVDLIDRARRLEYHTIIAGADSEQTASLALHRKFGFVEWGRQKETGYKFGRWLDVVFMQLML